MLTEKERKFLERAIELAREGMSNGRGGPFGCVIVRNDQIVGEGYNMRTDERGFFGSCINYSD